MATANPGRRAFSRPASSSGWRARGAIVARAPFDADQVQPASLDLRLGDTAYRVRSSFLPGPEHTVAERIEALKLHELDLHRRRRAGARLRLSRAAAGKPGPARQRQRRAPTPKARPAGSMSSPASSATARAASITLPAGYHGPALSRNQRRALSRSACARGSRLSQMRFRVGDTRLTIAEHQALHRRRDAGLRRQ